MRDGLQTRHVEELPSLLRGPDPVRIDVASWDEDAASALVKPLCLHEGAVRECGVWRLERVVTAGHIADGVISSVMSMHVIVSDQTHWG